MARESVAPAEALTGTPGFTHPGFLRRNGDLLAGVLGLQPSPVAPGTDLVRELLAFAAIGRPAELLPTHQRRAVLRAVAPPYPRRRKVAEWARILADWGFHEPSAAQRVYRVIEELRLVRGFPSPASVLAVSRRKMKAILRKAGIDPRESDTISALILRRSGILPAGSHYERLYRRIGIRVDREGVPLPRSFESRHVNAIRGGLAVLATGRCGPELTPGGTECKECPARRFCEAARRAGPSTPRRPEFIDLFAGAGGLSLGLERAGFRLRSAAEIDGHACDTLYINRPQLVPSQIIRRDVRRLLSDRTFLRRNAGIPLLVGGPPCQPFSIARRHDRPDRSDGRRFLYRQFIRLASRLQARMVLMENVPGIGSASDGQLMERIEAEFERCGFVVSHAKVNAAEYGVPQVRRRYIFAAVSRIWSRHPEGDLAAFWAGLERQKVDEPVTVADALGGLPPIDAGQGSLVLRKTRHRYRRRYSRMLARGEKVAFNHQAREHNPNDLRIFSEMRPGEVAREFDQRLPGLIRYSLESFSDKYRRLHPRRPSPTIPAHLHRDANGFVHPTRARGLTPREAARLQSFDDSYVFCGGFGPSFIQIGNALPPLFAEAAGNAARQVLASPALSIPPELRP